MSYLAQFVTVASIHLLAVMSPGPDFIMVSRNSLIYSRRTGVYSALGLALGIFVHITYSLAGIGLIIAKSVLIFTVLKFLGASYLIYIGLGALRSGSFMDIVSTRSQCVDITRVEAVKMGFLTNVTNPKVTLFFLSLFTLVIVPITPIWLEVLYGVEMSFATLIWFSIVACFFSSQGLKHRLIRVQYRIEKAMGAVLIFLGIKLALASSK